ncbi:coiled-coil domain-containing protein 7-like [Octodon degus]|uniref:Coiled-coil domain-containing protein 7-like n=1 Tax=Octodon degus TaxID=10160 RepID=A0A6P6DCG5_OCTDE|nr:coiled-coil domain-containing protein 7-like [Octodon degus]
MSEELGKAQDEEPEETPVLEPEGAASKLGMQGKEQHIPTEGRHSAQSEESDRTPMPEHWDAASKLGTQGKKQKPSKEIRHSIQGDEPDETSMPEHQDAASKLGMQGEKRKPSKEKRHSIQSEEPDKTPILDHEDSASKLEMQGKKEKSSKERHSIPDENLTFVPQDSMSKSQMQAERETISGEKAHDTPKQDESSENLLPEEKVLLSVSQSQIEKLEAISSETLKTQDTHESLESPVEYVGQVETTEVGQAQGMRTKYEVASQLPVTSENLPALYPTIDDIISHLDMDKVVENDVQHLRDAFGQHLQKDESETPSPSLPGTKDKHIPFIVISVSSSEFRQWHI